MRTRSPLQDIPHAETCTVFFIFRTGRSRILVILSVSLTPLDACHFVCLLFYLSVCLFICLSFCLSACLFAGLSFFSLSSCLPVYSVCLLFYLAACLFILSVCLPVSLFIYRLVCFFLIYLPVGLSVCLAVNLCACQTVTVSISPSQNEQCSTTVNYFFMNDN